MSVSTQGQINSDILHLQSRLSSVDVWYNLPGEGAPKGLQSRINIGFMETRKSILLNVNDLVQENIRKNVECKS